MIYCKIVDNVVVDRAVFEEPMPVDWPEFALYVQNDLWQIGWIPDGSGGYEPPPEVPE